MATLNQTILGQSFDCDLNGLVTSPGPFQGEPDYTVYFWQLASVGRRVLPRHIVEFDITDASVALFPQLGLYTRVRVWQDGERIHSEVQS